VSREDADRLEHVRRAKDLMDRDYGARLDLDGLAAEAGYSRYHFVRTFRATFGSTPGRYLSGRRIERAKDLLRGANLTVTEICFVVGFSSLGSFSARFKKAVGLSPSEYRDRAVRSGERPAIPGCFILMWSAREAPQSGRSARSSERRRVARENDREERR